MAMGVGGDRTENCEFAAKAEDSVFVDSSLTSSMECPECTPRSWTWEPAAPAPIILIVMTKP